MGDAQANRRVWVGFLGGFLLGTLVALALAAHQAETRVIDGVPRFVVVWEAEFEVAWLEEPIHEATFWAAVVLLASLFGFTGAILGAYIASGASISLSLTGAFCLGSLLHLLTAPMFNGTDRASTNSIEVFTLFAAFLGAIGGASFSLRMQHRSLDCFGFADED